MSSRTIFLAKLFGLYCVILSLAIFFRADATVATLKAIVQDPPLLFVTGILGLTAGLAIVLLHNVWSGGALPILITLFGWASLIKGILILLLSPETQSRLFFAQIHFEQYPYVVATVLLLLGTFLTFAGFRSTPSTT